MADIFENRRITAAVVSTVATSLTAMIVGAAPVSAKPGGGDGGGSQQTTTETPAPEAPKQKPPKQSKPEKTASPADEAPATKAPAADPPPAHKPQPAADPPAETAPPKQTEAPVVKQTEAPAKQTAAPAAPETTADKTPEPKTTESKAPESKAPEPRTTEPKTTESKAPESTADPTQTSERSRPPTSAERPVTSVTQSPTTTPAEHSNGPKRSDDAGDTPKPAGDTDKSADDSKSGTPKPAGDPKSRDGARSSDDPQPSDKRVPAGSDRSQTQQTSRPARPIENLKPQTLQAPSADIDVAKAAPAVELKPSPAQKQDVSDLAKIVKVADFAHDNRAVPDDRDRRGGDDRRGPDDRRDHDGPAPMGRDWDNRVRQWQPDWVQYDDYYRPVICNPYHDTVRIVYVYQGAPRIVYVPPLQRIVMEVADLAAYSFTAVVVNAVNTAVNVAVGSFFGGGYYPGVGMPPPPPPPPVLRYDNVPVQVRYSQATYQPFRVSRVVDVGDDPQYGEHKVLLDGVTPAWGQWVQNSDGARQFEVHKTQQFPGLDEPREAPLAGDYQLQLLSDEKPADDGKHTALTIAATACGVLSLGAVGAAVWIGRRRRQS